MDGEFSNNFEEIIQNLGDRIEDIERILNDDEDFCNNDIDATYQAALKYLKTFEIKFNKKLIELKNKLDRIRDENLHLSKQNKQEFDVEIEEINQLFSSGKHQEALEKFHQYEEHFQQRTTIIQNIPKLYMQDIDINRYFSIDKPIIVTPEIPKQNLLEHVKQTKTHLPDDVNEQESNSQCFDIRFRRSTNQPITKPTDLPAKESQPSLPIIAPRSPFFSTRLSTSSSTKSLSINEYDLNTTTLSKQTSIRNSRENINNPIQVRSALSSPNILPSLIQIQTSTIKTSRTDGLSPIYIAAYQHEQNTSAYMTYNQNSIILLRSQANRLSRWYSIRFDRSDLKDTDGKWHNLVIKSIGFIDQTHIYIFTEREFLIYSSDLSIKYNSRILLNANNYHSEYNNIHLGYGGTVHNRYIYHLYLNIKSHWILSILELESINHIFDHDLTESFPDVKNFIDIYINDRIISFLVEMDGSQYAVLFCSNTINSKIELKRCIQLSYAEKPHRICSVFIPYIRKEIYFINDPSAKIIHLLTQEKYLQSYSIIAHTLCYIEDNQELILTSNDGLYSIHINEQQNFFSKFH